MKMLNALLTISFFLMVTAMAGPAFAATFYISPSGSDLDPGTEALPWATFEHAFKSGMVGGDTLIIKEGTYSQPLGEEFSNAPYNSYSAPSGTAAAYTVIKAETDGLAIIQDASIYLGGKVTSGIPAGSAYIQVEGLKLVGGKISMRASNHIKILRTGIKNGVAIDSRYGSPIRIKEASHHILVEDTWVIGTMARGVWVSDSSEVILRRLVVRFDGNSEQESKTGIRISGTNSTDFSSNGLVQNALILDFNDAPRLDHGVQLVGVTKNIRQEGCIILNIPDDGVYLNDHGSAGDNEILNTVLWDLNGNAMAIEDSDPALSTLINQVTAGQTPRGINKWSGSHGTTSTITVKNNLFTQNGDSNMGGHVTSFNHYDPSWQSQGTNTTTGDIGLLYLTETTDAGTGEAGAKRGATIKKRIGTSGTLWGDTGYDQVTTEDLWPWAFEDRIHTDAREADGFSYPATDWQGNPYPVTVNNTARGFAAVGQTLTKYVWEYLGNPIPADIYGGTNSTPVAEPQAVNVNEDASVAVTLTATDADSDPLTFNVTVNPSQGSLSGTAPNLTYTPNADYNGADSFTFTATDGIDTSAAAAVSVTILPINDAPVLVLPADPVVNEGDTQLPVISATDVDSSDTVTITHSALEPFMSFDGSILTLSPGFDDSGSYPVIFTASDGTLSDNGTLNITVVHVNRAPTANALSLSTDEDTSGAVTLTGSDPDGDAITFAINTQPSNGTVTIDGTVATYTPNPSIFGPDSFTVTSHDGTLSSAPATVSVTVNPVNDPPALGPLANMTVAEDDTQNTPIPATDIDGDTVTVTTPDLTPFMSFDGTTLTVTPGFEDAGGYILNFTATDGVLSVSGSMAVTVTQTNRAPVANAQNVATDEDVSVNVTLTGSDPDGDSISFTVVTSPANGTLSGIAPNLTYTPDTGFSGSDSFTFNTHDGAVASPNAVVSIAVNPIAPPPPENAFYISPSGSDTNPGTSAAPWATFEHAFKNGLAGGDTLIIKDGVYTQPLGEHFSSAPYNSYSAPSGTAAGYTVIKAETDGGAIIQDASIYLGGKVTSGVAAGSAYIQIEGLKLLRSKITMDTSDHIKILRTGVKNGSPIDQQYAGVVKIRQASHHILLEDFWVIGTMGRGIEVSDSSQVILRRVLVRFDGNSHNQSKAGIRFYGSSSSSPTSDCWVENAIFIDFNDSGVHSGIQNIGNTQNIRVTGTIALNLPARGIYLNDTGASGDNSVTNSVFWDLTKDAVSMQDSDSIRTTLIEQITAGAALRGTGKWSGSSGTTSLITVKNNLFTANVDSNQGGHIIDYNHYDPSWQSQGTNNITGDPALLYILETTDAGTGEAGATRGATIRKRFGTSGTLWGETGYDQITTENLWPWPHENRIHADAREADGFSYPTTNWEGNPYTVVNDPARGFAALGQTLTKYIWEYLGNPIPEDIYGEQPPAAPVVEPVTTPTNIIHQQILGSRDPDTSVWMDSGVGYEEIAPLDASGAPWSIGLSLGEGLNAFSFVLRSASGIQGTPVDVLIDVDTSAPVITLTAPSDGLSTNQSSVSVEGAVDDVNATITVNGDSVPLSLGMFQHALSLNEGTNPITVEAVDALGNTAVHNSITVIRDSIGPATPTINPPATPTFSDYQMLAGTLSADSAGLSVECSTAVVDPNDLVYNPAAGTWSCPVESMQEGTNTVLVIAADSAGNISDPAITSIVKDSVPPPVPDILQITDTDGNEVDVTAGILYTPSMGITVSGAAFQDTTEIIITSTSAQIGTVTADPDPAQIIRDWSVPVTLAGGHNDILVQAQDITGNLSNIVTLSIFLDDQPPAVIFTFPMDGDVLGPVDLTPPSQG